MLRKLLKYDLLATSKLSLALIIASLTSSLVAGACNWLGAVVPNEPSYDVLQSAIALFEFFSTFGVIIGLAMVPILVFVRFYKNLYTDEGYLTFTLPTSRTKIHLSKTITAFIWIAVDVIAATVCIDLYYLFKPEAGDVITSITVGILDSLNAYESWGWMVIYILLVILVLSALAFLFINVMHLSITVGAVLVRKAKVLVGVVCYYAISSALQMAATVGLILISYYFDLTLELAPNLDMVSIHIITIGLLLLITVLIVILAAATFAITQRIINKKLNLL